MAWSCLFWIRTSETRRHFEQAEVYVGRKDGPRAEAEWLAIVRDDSTNILAQELLAEYYLSHQDWKKGAQQFAVLHALAPNKEHLLCKMAACQIRADDQPAALTTAQREIERDPNCVAALGLVATVNSRRSGIDRKQQLAYLRRLSKLLPDDLDIQRTYAETLTDQFLYDELRPVIARLLMRNPQDVQAHNLLGLADMARSDQPQGANDAVQHFQKSLAITRTTRQTNIGAHLGLGRAYLSLQRPDDAVVELEQANRIQPDFARVMTELAMAYQRTNQPQKAAALRQRLALLKREAAQAQMLRVRCITHPNNPEYPRRLAKIFLQTGDPEQALFYLDRAAKLLPNDREIQSLIPKAQRAVLSLSSGAK